MAEYLPRCMGSLLAQDLSECEILLIDDGSTDELSGPLCDRYAAEHPGVVRTLHRENGGLGAARNTGLDAANGEYVLFVDSDDHVCPQMLQTLDTYMTRQADVVIFRLLLEKDGARINNESEPEFLGGPFTLKELPRLLLLPPNACNKLWRRELFEAYRIRFPEGVWYEDIAVTGKLLALSERIFVIPDALYVYLQREGSIIHSRSITRNLEIRDTVSELLRWFREEELFSLYCEELEALTLRNVLLDASVRILKNREETGKQWRGLCFLTAEQQTALEELYTFTELSFPEWRKNPYSKELTWKHRIALRLLAKKRYRILKIVFRETRK